MEFPQRRVGNQRFEVEEAAAMRDGET